MDDMRKKMCGAERFAVWFKKFLKLCIVVLLLSAALFEIWRIWGAQHKPIDTADNGQMTAPLLPLQNPTLISGEHGYRSNKEEISEPFAVTSKSKETEERWDEEIPWFIKGCKGLETESKPVSQDIVLGKLQALVYLVTIVVLLITMISVYTTMMAMVAERKREIGLKKALGAENIEDRKSVV